MLAGTVSDSGSTLTRNLALGGAGGAGGNGGNGLGGGIYVASGTAVSLTGSTVTKNHANGGTAGAGGSAGQGIGGGVYDLGTFTFDVTTVIAGNHASTNNDDIFP